jgi:hypothetical protein
MYVLYLQNITLDPIKMYNNYQFKSKLWLGMVCMTNSSTQETEAGRVRVRGQPGYTAGPCLQENKKI